MSIRSVVIVPVDGSRDSRRTVDFAARLAEWRGAEVHAIEVVGTGDAPRLTAVRPSADHEGVRVRLLRLRGIPERVIPAYARLHPGSVIVVARNYRSFWFWRTGAVASRLSRWSPVPVFVIPARGAKADGGSWDRIIAAVDPTVGCLGTEAVRLASDTVAPMVVTGDPHRGIVETAVERNADLIVMGGAPDRLDETTSGSTVHAVLRRAKTPVLVLPVIAGAHDVIGVRRLDEVSEPRAFAIAGIETQPESERRRPVYAGGTG